MIASREEKIARLRLIRSRNIGNATFWSLIRLYGSAMEAVERVPKIGVNLKFSLCDSVVLNKEIDDMRRFGGRFIFFEDESYPQHLREICNPPPVLSFFGNKDLTKSLLQKKVLAVVGSRNATLNGMNFCQNLCEELAKSMCIVSGMARGIDTSAHIGSLKNGTIAVLAGGINKVYPPENQELYKAISENGGIYSETPFDTAPQSSLFPKRNALIAGMSNAVLVVEAAYKSGSLITAKMAKEYNRHIFAVPNSPVDQRSQGGNMLIKQGAHVVTSAKDILDYFFKSKNETLISCASERKIFKNKIKLSTVNDIKNEILRVLDAYSVTFEEIIEYIESSPTNVLQAIVELELEGKIRRIYGNVIKLIC